MDLDMIWKVLVIFAIGTLFLRISGRKTISQMTMPEAIIMIAFGTMLIQPVTSKSIWTTMIVGAIFILALVVTELIQVKSDLLETIISGKSVVVVEKGKLNEKSLKKLRLTVDKLEERLRQLGIASINDLEMVTVEVNGKLGYTLKPEKQPATKEDIQALIQLIQSGKMSKQIINNKSEQNMFSEITNQHSADPPPKYLQ
ncbi:DUF421 domain-containing protein [Lederbergia wuyishanensis]|uniref:Uncharacterized membrane protein YcaP (DUF421 family) n=1 Tax=Lederbergia wuyishanensis TaxID=1347903 RepID=A0ABU0D6R0_9BACI|nr:YetF domain-containing protein [Lederbergia wuyishanensis]MCJ8008778.1 DUF421 domain-containing protein [Lederbergia wuyishanensis]MDQ0344099.1 uncharacterized membrane protein YcaP (DUF421 family) [Lederbergia wuyishanensis]